MRVTANRLMYATIAGPPNETQPSRRNDKNRMDSRGALRVAGFAASSPW